MEMVYLSEPDSDSVRDVSCLTCGLKLRTRRPIERIRHNCLQGAGGRGPGWHMADMLKQLGIKGTRTCRCFAKQMEMDNLGVEGCEREFDRLLKYLQENYGKADISTKIRALKEAFRRRLPKTLNGLLREAIKRARKEESVPPAATNAMMAGQ